MGEKSGMRIEFGVGPEAGEETDPRSESFAPHRALEAYWPRVMSRVDELSSDHLRTEAQRNQELPLARIKKIMKLDDEVKAQMISAEAPILLAVASQWFVQELTLRAWAHTDDNKRKTLQKNDVAMAIAKNEQFDFLIDIVPREEAKARPSVPSAPSVPAQSSQGPSVGLGQPQQVTLVGSSGSGDSLQYYVQMAGGGEGLAVASGAQGLSSGLSSGGGGPVLTATQIGQPIRLEGISGENGVQLITLPDSSGQPVQLQLLPGQDPDGALIAQLDSHQAPTTSS